MFPSPYFQNFPYQREPNSYPCQYCSGSGFVPSPSHEFIHPNLSDHNGCCHHSFPHGYYNLSPQICTNVHPPSHSYYYGPYFHCPSSYPAYFVPHPQKYDYDKTQNHCCGCRNGTYYQRGDTSPKIEEAINNLKGSSQEDEGKNEKAQKQSLFPIIWMPGYDKLQEAVTDSKEITPKSVKEPEKLKIIPLELLGNDDYEENSRALEESKNEVQKEMSVEKERKTKTIPVKPMEERSQKKSSVCGVQEEKVDKKKATNFEKQKKESEMHKNSEEGQSSPKLRPVCLRVDPLPKKRITNGTSKSPGMKDHQHNEEPSSCKDTGKETSERKHIVNLNNNGSSKSVEEQKCKENIRVVPVGDLSKEPSVKNDGIKSVSEPEMEGGKEHESSSENKEVKENKGIKCNLSQIDAAVIIQSAYRGFEVRRWQPLEKLRKIGKIREEAECIRRQLQSVGASPKALGAKEKIFFGEMIMNLLLQLDTIQGLHPSVREVRKTVARELVRLQEKLDSLGCVEENKAHNDEEKTRTTAERAAFASSDGIEESESLEVKINSIDSTVMKPVDPDVNAVVFSCDAGASPVSRTSSLNETTDENCTDKQPMLEHVQPAEENCTNKQPTMEDYDRSDRSKQDVTSPMLTSEPAQDTSTYLSAKTDRACWREIPSESLSNESDPKQDKLEKMERGIDRATEFAEFASAPLLVINSDCKKDESNTLGRVDVEDNNLLISGGATLDHDVNNCLQPHQDMEVKYQEHEAAPVGLEAEDDNSSNHSDITARAENDDGMCNGSILCPDQVKKIGNVKVTGSGDFEALAANTSEIIESNDENELRVFSDEIEGSPASELFSAKDVGDGIAKSIESLSASLINKDAEDKYGLHVNKDVNKERKLVDENEKLKDIVEKLLEAGKEQSDVISNLQGRVKDLERKLVQKKKKKRRAIVKQNRPVKSLT